METAVDFSIQDDMPSGPEAVLEGRQERRLTTRSSVQRSELGQGSGGVEGGRGDSGEADELKHELKKELRQEALSRSDWNKEPLDERVGIVDEDLRRDFTKDQNLEGEKRDREWKKEAFWIV